MTAREKLEILEDRYSKIKERPDASKYSTSKKIMRQIRKLERELA